MRTKWTYAQLNPTDSEWMLDDDHEEEGREPARYRDEYDRKEKTARLGVLTTYNQGRQRWESMGNDTDHSTDKTEGLPSL